VKRARAHGNRETLASLSRTGNEGKTGSLAMEITGRVICRTREKKRTRLVFHVFITLLITMRDVCMYNTRTRFTSYYRVTCDDV
jgi:hypothetical protein